MTPRVKKFVTRLETWPWGAFLVKWGRIARLLAANIRKRRVAIMAQSLAYSTILSLVPIVAIFFSILGNITKDQQVKDKIQEFISIYLIPEYVNQLFIQVERLANLSLALGVIGFPALFLAGVFLYAKVGDAVNEIWDMGRDRKWFSNGLAFFMTLFFGPMLLVLVFSIPPYLHSMPYYGDLVRSPLFEAVFSQLVPIFVTTLGLQALYFYIPNVKVKGLAALKGALFAAILIQLTNWALGYYFSNFNTLNLVYGPLVTFPIMLLWLFVVWVVVLGGAALTFVLQYHQATQYKFVENLYNDESLLNNGLQVLLCLVKAFEEGEEALDLSQLHFRLSIHKKRLHFILNQLLAKGFVVKLEASHADFGGGSYQLGKAPKMIRLQDLAELLYNYKAHFNFEQRHGDLLNQLAVHPYFLEEGQSLAAVWETRPKPVKVFPQAVTGGKPDQVK